MYLGAPTCISFQDTFGSESPWSSLVQVKEESQLVHPNYKEYVKPAMLRRMSSALKMGVAGGTESIRKAGIANADAITVGTGLGCVRDTLKFLKAVYQDGEGGLSPTAFIQSTHNSIAGQLALMLGNHGYNMTHVQGALSLGYALSDAELLIAENDAETVLVGAVDEKTEELIELLSELAEDAEYKLPTIGEGGVFFLASKNILDSSIAKMVVLEMDEQTTVNGEFDLVLSNSTSKMNGAFDYTKYCGEHFTSSGFGLFLGLKAIEAGKVVDEGLNIKDARRVLVHHRLFGQELRIVLEKV
jgi:hypothetical protein